MLRLWVGSWESGNKVVILVWGGFYQVAETWIDSLGLDWLGKVQGKVAGMVVVVVQRLQVCPKMVL